MNQEKMSQPQILLRSANFDIDQNFMGTVRKESFGINDSYGPQLNASGNDGLESKLTPKGNRLFDLEDEDNMAMVDQAVDDIEEYFLRVSLLNKVVHVYPIVARDDPVDEFEDAAESDRQMPNESLSTPSKLRQGAQLAEPESPTKQVVNKEKPVEVTCMIDTAAPKQSAREEPDDAASEEEIVNRRSQTDVKVGVGHAEAEVTEHSIRKIMECIVQDFPRSGTSEFPESQSSPPTKSEK